ncbi:tape measure protein [Sinorhizobium sp. B11]
MAGKDIDLVIRAKDRASGELDKISKALKKNVGDMDDVAKGAGKTSDALGKIASQAQKFEGELNKLQAAGKVAAELDKATAAVTRMEGSLRSNAGELAKLARDSDAAAQAATRLKAQLAAEENSLASNKNALAASRKELAEVNKQVRQAEQNQARYNKQLGSTPDHFVRPAAKSAGAFISADLPAQKNAQAQVIKQVQEYQDAIKQSSDAIKNLRPQVSAATSLQNQLGNEVARTAIALNAERDDLGKARTELDSIRGVSAKAGEALGGVAISQENVSAAAQRMAANLAAAKARIEGLSNVKTISGASDTATAAGGIDVQALATQRRAVLEARREWVAAQTDVKALAQQMRAAEAPTEELGAAFGAAQAKARLAKQEYESQRQALASLGGSANATFKEFSRSASAIRQIAPAAQQTSAAMASASGQTSAFARALATVGKENARTVSVLQSIRSEILGLTASYIGFQAALGQVSGAVDSFRQLEAVQSRLGSVFNQDTGKVATEVAFLRDQADRLGISFGTLADEYGKFAVAARAANFTTEDTRKIFISLAEAARVNQLSVAETSGVFLALTQMISKGKVSAEELRGQLGERLPGAFNIFATAIGKSTAELDQMMQKGDVLADRSTLLRFADELTRRFGPQLGASLQSLTTDLGRFQNDVQSSQIAVANGFVPALQSALQSFHSFAQSSDGQNTFTAIGKAVGEAIKVLAEVPKYFDLIAAALKVFAAAKVAELFGGLAGKMLQAVSAMQAFNRELTLVGPRTQAATNSQTMFGRALAQSVSSLGSFRQNLLASTSQSALARTGVVSLASAVGGLQTALVVTATGFRALLAAFGGPIGIALTAVTYAVGTWLTSIGNATSAVEEHKRQIDIVVAAYNAAGDKAGDWAKKISGVTMAQAIASVQDLKKQFDKTAASAEESSRRLTYAFQDFPSDSPQVRQLAQFQDALKAARSGAISVKELESALNDIALNPADEQLKQIALEILNIVNNAGEGETSLKDLGDAIASAEALVRQMNGAATDADKALLGLGKSAQETSQNLDYQGKATAFNKLLLDMQENIPGVGEELKKLEALKGLEKQYKDAMNLATTMGQVLDATKAYSDAVAGINQSFMQKQFDSLPNISGNLIDRIIRQEGGQDGTGPSTSSARGIGQFTEGTWLPIFNRLFPALQRLTDAQKLGYRSRDEFARPVLQEFTKQNQMQLANAGVAPTDTNTYLAHFLGAGDAIKVVLANPDELAKNLVDPASAAANPTVIKSDTTARDLINWSFQKIGSGSPIMAGGQTKQESFDQGITGRVKAWKDEADARKDSNKEAKVARELAQAENEAIKEGVTLSQAQRDAIKEAAAAKYDSAHADEQLKANQQEAREQLNDIIGLDQQRKNLLQEINMAQNAGDSGRTQELVTQLQGVNDQLSAAVPKALELARALGDEKMVAQLQKVQLNTAKVGSGLTAFGLSASNVQELVGSFANGLVGAFDNFAQSVANGANAFQALGQAFLQFAADFLRQIATMILQQMILNALAGFGGPIGQAAQGLGGVAKVITGHTGGLVGSAAIGGGNMSRQLNFDWVGNIMRYHSGGIAGLRPDEVPAVLKKNEEVLTEQDPRHRFNSGQEKPSESKGGQPIKQVLVLNERDLSNAVASSHGEKVVITHIKNNAQTIRKVLGV